MLAMVPMVYRSFSSGLSTEMSFCPTSSTGSPAFMAASSALTEMSRATSKWIITLGTHFLSSGSKNAPGTRRMGGTAGRFGLLLA